MQGSDRQQSVQTIRPNDDGGLRRVDGRSRHQCLEGLAHRHARGLALGGHAPALRGVFLEGDSYALLMDQYWPMALIALVSLTAAAWLFRHRMY